VATALDFPSDVYALGSHLRLHGHDPAADLILVPTRDSRTIDEDDIIAAMTDRVALVVLPAVLYRSGQLLDLERLTSAAHARSIPIGFDCAHSIGVVPHQLDAWAVDFAFWCCYKYLNGGPGSVGGLYVNQRHHGVTPGLAGWWGYQKERQFDMSHEWAGAPEAGAWQISTPPILATAPLIGSLNIFAEIGIEAVRDKSLAQTAYLIDLIEASGLTDARYGYRIGTPRECARRGGHVAVEHHEAAAIARTLRTRGVVPDFRPPNVIRLAPIPLYNTFHELWRVVAILREVVEREEYRTAVSGRALVT
jgi:kynureninase